MILLNNYCFPSFSNLKMVCETFYCHSFDSAAEIYITGDHEHSKTGNKTDIKLSKDYENILKTI